MIDNAVQEATEREDRKMKGVIKSVIDKDGEDYLIYQINLK